VTSDERLRAYATISWRLLVCAAAVAVVVLAALFLRVVVIGLLFGMILAALLTPVQTGLRKLRVPRSVAAVVCLLLAIGLVAGAIALAAVALVDQWEFVREEIDERSSASRTGWASRVATDRWATSSRRR
jgi:predicted PurR-regulated permease PerM